MGVGARGCFRGKGAALSTSAAARDAALGAAKPPRLRREHHQEGEVGEGEVIRLVVSRPGARRAPAASGSTEHEWRVSAGGDAFWFGGGLEEAW